MKKLIGKGLKIMIRKKICFFIFLILLCIFTTNSTYANSLDNYNYSDNFYNNNYLQKLELNDYEKNEFLIDENFENSNSSSSGISPEVQWQYNTDTSLPEYPIYDTCNLLELVS